MRIPGLALLDFFEDSLGADGALVLRALSGASAASRNAARGWRGWMRVRWRAG